MASRADEILHAVALALEARRECLEDRGLRSVTIEAKVNAQTGEIRAVLLRRRKIDIVDKGIGVNSF